MEKIYTKNKKLVIEIPLKVNRHNPYDKDFKDEMDNIVGVIAGNDIGFANWIDMDYAGKEDQISEIFYKFFGDKDSFINLCNSLDIAYYEYPICDKCFEPIYGCFTYDKGKKICFNCDNAG